jgi:hypothetical protein
MHEETLAASTTTICARTIAAGAGVVHACIRAIVLTVANVAVIVAIVLIIVVVVRWWCAQHTRVELFTRVTLPPEQTHARTAQVRKGYALPLASWASNPGEGGHARST